ncbi:MAG: HD domain-containing protein, partial [Lachnospiraceae bacterium]|nr:HD domain-containing protein [Lachnospiraceae bacterium]
NQKKEPVFSPEKKEELLMSVWLHDIGKLVTPLEVMNKMHRLLPDQYQNFQHRMEIIRLNGKIERLKGVISEDDEQALYAQIEQVKNFVEQLNKAGFLSDEQKQELDLLARRTYLDEQGEQKPWLLPEEYRMLSIPRGTLSEEERKIMEEHVVITDKLLAQIQFSDEFSHVREWASSHHELLNGTGYPKKLSKDAIPTEVRIITILDIFDALVADDRPYKPGMPVEKALSILTAMAQKEGKLDPELTRQFIESRCWEDEHEHHAFAKRHG